MKKTILMLCLMLSPTIAWCDDASKREQVQKLMQMMDIQKMMDSAYDQLIPSMQKVLQQEADGSEAQRAIEAEFFQKSMNIARDAMSWDKVQDRMMDIYIKHYTEKEIDDLVAFYSSETGQSMLRKMPLVLSETTRVAESQMQIMMPKMRQLGLEYQAKLKECGCGKSAKKQKK